MKKDVSAHVKYLISNEQDVAWGMVVTTAGSQNIEPGTPYPSPNHPGRYLFSTRNGRILTEYQLVYISRGRGYFASSSQKETEIHEGLVFLLFPGEWHTYYPDPQTGWHESWIGFTGRNMDKRVEAGFFHTNKPIFNVGIQEDILTLFKRAVGVSCEQRAGYQQMLAGIVNLLVGLIYSGDRQNAFEDIKVTNQINRAKIIMQENIGQNLSCEEIAEQVGMGYSWFRRVFKEYTGFAPAQYMKELKINTAKELLTNTPMSCQEIAYETGFETASYFNAVFRQKIKMTPGQYRAMTQGSFLMQYSQDKDLRE